MAKVFDEENVHDLWGLSPSVDVLELLDHLPVSVGQHSMIERLMQADAVNLLQIGACDCRHSANLLAGVSTRTVSSPVIHVWIYEEAPELLARHMMLLSVLLDTSFPVRQRAEMFIELHGNACIQTATAAYLEKQSQMLEALTLDSSAGQQADSLSSELFDLSLLRFQQRDDIAEAFRRYSSKVPFDMQKAWDARSRKFYGPRYDHRRNAIDWDYHMRLAQQGTPGMDPSAGSIIHFYHFRRWREAGIAYELRDCRYSEPNRSMLTTAYGKRKEFKDRLGNDQGRSVSAWGFWGDMLNSPYHCFGSACNERSFFKVSNKQFTHTAVSVSEYNVMAVIEEVQSGQPYTLPTQGLSASKLAAGPTTLEDLEEMADKANAESSSDTSQTGSSQQQQAIDAQGQAHQKAPAPLQTAEAPEAQPAAQDSDLRERLKRIRFHFLTGDINKVLLSRSSYANKFSAITVGHRHVHLVDQQHGLSRVAAPGSVLALETVKYMLQLTGKQVDLFAESIATKAAAAGWQSLDSAAVPPPDAHLLFVKPE